MPSQFTRVFLPSESSSEIWRIVEIKDRGLCLRSWNARVVTDFEEGGRLLVRRKSHNVNLLARRLGVIVQRIIHT